MWDAALSSVPASVFASEACVPEPCEIVLFLPFVRTVCGSINNRKLIGPAVPDAGFWYDLIPACFAFSPDRDWLNEFCIFSRSILGNEIQYQRLV